MKEEQTNSIPGTFDINGKYTPTDMDIAVGNLIDQEIAAGRLDPDWVEKRREEIRKKGI